jgi:hypothetical protein
VSAPRGVVRYQCECGTEYLVAFHDGHDEAWIETVDSAALALGLTAVDGSEPTFVCSYCGAWHGRTDDAAGLSRIVTDRARAASRR